MNNNQQISLKIDKDTYDTMQILKEILLEQKNQKLNDNELLKIVVANFMAFIQWNDEEK